LTVGLTGALSARVANELRVNTSLNRTGQSFDQAPFGGVAPLSDALLCPSPLSTQDNLCRVIFNFSGYSAQAGAGPLITTEQRQLNLVDSIDWSFGTHRVKAGIDYRRLSPLANHTSWFDLDFRAASTRQTGIPTYVNLSTYRSGMTTDINQTSV